MQIDLFIPRQPDKPKTTSSFYRGHFKCFKGQTDPWIYFNNSKSQINFWHSWATKMLSLVFPLGHLSTD